jgi:EF-P beta-lysylation protein EpmB
LDELCELLNLTPDELPLAPRRDVKFPLLVPREYVARMRPGDPADPLLLQVLPLVQEQERQPGFVADPVGDVPAALAPGVLQKYAGRVLVVTTGACAIHCRYCFRRNFDYDELPGFDEHWQQVIEQVQADETLAEVILSGGDPLVLSDQRLERVVRQIAAIPHVARLRVHTRLPIVIPSRIGSSLVRLLRGTRLTPWVVVHANHPQELDESVAAALGKLVDAGIPTLNQAVLLRGINDDARVLAELCERLVELRVMPYYLHQLDRVQGGAHFEVPIAEGQALVAKLHRRLPGYAVPRYVAEVPGEAHKTPL